TDGCQGSTMRAISKLTAPAEGGEPSSGSSTTKALDTSASSFHVAANRKSSTTVPLEARPSATAPGKLAPPPPDPRDATTAKSTGASTTRVPSAGEAGASAERQRPAMHTRPCSQADAPAGASAGEHAWPSGSGAAHDATHDARAATAIGIRPTRRGTTGDDSRGRALWRRAAGSGPL